MRKKCGNCTKSLSWCSLTPFEWAQRVKWEWDGRNRLIWDSLSPSGSGNWTNSSMGVWRLIAIYMVLNDIFGMKDLGVLCWCSCCRRLQFACNELYIGLVRFGNIIIITVHNW